MLVRSVPERALGALLGGESAAGVLYKHLVELSKAVAAPSNAAESTTEDVATPQSKITSPANLALNLRPLRKELRDAIQTEIDERTGRSYRLNESELGASRLCDATFLTTPEIPALDDMIKAFIVCKDGNLYFADIHVQRYAEVLSEQDPTLLVAWHLVRKTATKGQGKRSTLHQSVGRLTTMFVGPRFLSLPFAENHVHLNGITGEDLVLAQLVLGHNWLSTSGEQSQLEKNQLHRICRIRRILVALSGIWGGDDANEASVPNDRTVDLLNACWDDAELAGSYQTINWEFMVRGIVVEDEGRAEAEHGGFLAADEDNRQVTSKWLLQRLADACCKHELQRAWTWLFILLWRTYRAKTIKPEIRAIVLLVVADMMVLRRQMVMDGSGLRRFTTRFFHSQLRKEAASHRRWHETSMRETARRLFVRSGDRAEIKICSSSLKSRDVAAAFAYAANAHMQTLARTDRLQSPEMGPLHSRRHWHFCVHFNRLAKSSRVELWKQAKALRDVLYSVERWDLALPFGDSLGVGSEHLVYPAELIRGLDVVGDETRTSIEMFSPMLRWLRASTAKLDPLNESIGLVVPVPKISLNIHAGEDYAHPLSGLRCVDETVMFCEMRAGDRLGHALALGIPPDEWLQRHGEVILSVDEHFDNLIWAWAKAVELSHLLEAQKVRSRLETRIARVLPQVSWYPWVKGSPTPTALEFERFYDAWKLRKNCAYMAAQEAHTGVSDSRLDVGVPNQSRIREHFKHPSIHTPEGLFVIRARLEIASPTPNDKPIRHVRLTVPRHGHVTRRLQQQESRDTETLESGEFLYDHDDLHDLRFMLALQDACIERYSRLGLSIETNPSSNVYIGQLQTHSDHPIYRWNPLNHAALEAGGMFNQFNLRTQPIAVTINTDDPGMIPTTLRMEFHLMHEAAIDRGHSESEADNWIEQLRQLGMKHFEDAH